MRQRRQALRRHHNRQHPHLRPAPYCQVIWCPRQMRSPALAGSQTKPRCHFLSNPEERAEQSWGRAYIFNINSKNIERYSEEYWTLLAGMAHGYALGTATYLHPRPDPGSLHHTVPSGDVPLDTRLRSENVVFNGTLTTPTY
jgi:hypothetical protein